MFDPYRKWLGIPDGQRPPTHYQLLGIAPDEHDRDVINAAVVRQSAFVRNFQTGEHAEDATRLLNEIAAAKVCLLDPVKRAEYDARLNQTARPKSDSESAYQRLRSSSLTAPPGAPATRPLAARSPAAARSDDRLLSPLVRPYSPPAPAVRPLEKDTTSGIWTDVEQVPTARRSLRLQPVRKKPPAWLWAVPAGACGLLVFVLLVVALTRRPANLAVSQSNAGMQPGSISSRVENRELGGTSLPIGSSLAPSPQESGTSTAASSVMPGKSAFAPPVADAPARAAELQTPGDSSLPATDEERPPFTVSAAPPSTSMPADPPGAGIGEVSLDVEGPSWSDGSTFSIAVPRDAGVTFARANGPFVVVGETVYSLLTGQPVGRATSASRSNALSSLSADGKYFAAVNGSMLDVRECKSGSAVGAWQEMSGLSFIDFLEFADADRLIISTRASGEQRLQVWNISAEKPGKEVRIDGNLRDATLSADGRYLAMEVSNYGIVIYDVLRGPSRGKGKISARIPITPLERRFVDVEGMRFASSGDELAALCDNGARLLCWDKTTHLVFEQTLGTDLSAFWSGAMSYRGPAVEWAPGGRGWLLKGHTFLDRQRRRVTWFLKTEHDAQARHRFIDDDRLLVVRGRGDDRELVDMKIPWKKIDDSFAAMKDAQVAAWLGPQAPAAVHVKVGSAADGTSQEQLADELKRLFAARMADDGVPMGESGAASFSIEYSETYQPPQTISPPPNLARMRINLPPRQVPGHTNCTMTIRFHANGNPVDLWTTTINASAQDDPKLAQRSAVYAELGRKLQSAVLPFFIPKDKDLIALPAVIHP